ncbi:MerR family transcriptional regulator [Erythrobacter aurantius]|uniref:MerR family transcriptional regulator n=1 Tax=Erythrobacter aurantius TaxID=2909249 RepID=UPI00207A5455|nr:MerR family transcriptional regulator [Erythrobacter aurantius]
MIDFNDGKDRSAFRTIGEVSEALGIKPHVLRYWEQQFSLLKPLKRSGGRRHYRPSDVEMVEKINRLVNEEGYTLKGAEAVLRSAGGGEHDRRKGDRRSGDRRSTESPQGEPQAAASAPSAPAAVPQETIAKLKQIRARLAKAVEA